MPRIEVVHDSDGTASWVRRPFSVPINLDRLAGPGASERVSHLPVHLNWGPIATFDLSNSTYLRELYSQLLAVASESELEEYLNVELLRTYWDDIQIPPVIRNEWVRRFPELAS